MLEETIDLETGNLIDFLEDVFEGKISKDDLMEDGKISEYKLIDILSDYVVY